MQNVFTRNVPPYFLGGEETGSICKWGHQDYFKRVFLQKDSTRTKGAKSTKSTKRKQTLFIPLKKILNAQKAASFVIFCSLIFVLLVCFFCLRVFLCTYISFASLLVCACKFFCIFSLKKIINRYGLDGLIYQYYWRDSYRPSYEKFICTHLFLFV